MSESEGPLAAMKPESVTQNLQITYMPFEGHKPMTFMRIIVGNNMDYTRDYIRLYEPLTEFRLGGTYRGLGRPIKGYTTNLNQDIK